LYIIEKDINYIAERTTNTNVEFVNLFQRHDNPWMNGGGRSMNLQLDRALMRRDSSHIGIIDAASIAREDFTTHGLHLRRLTHLIAERVIGGHVSSISSIPVITHARASPFLA
jgi:hypothetical protein